MAYAALVSLCQLLDHTLHHDHRYFYVPRGDERRTLESIHEKSSFLISFLDECSSKGGEPVQSLGANIRDVAYRLQDFIELDISYQIATSIEHHGVKKGCCRSILSIAQKKKQRLGTRSVNYKEHLLLVLDVFDLIVEEAKNIQISCSSIEETQITTAQTPALASSSQAGNSKNKMVGYEEDLIGIQERLCGESTKLKSIPIVGMGGIGKTTLARNLFDDSLIEYHFHTRAWGTISQQYNLKGLLLGILHSLTLKTEGLAGEIQRSYSARATDESLKESVYRSLKGKRYLIVLDDMWSTETWDDLRMIFPDDNNGSRIIITSRLRDVAEYASSSSLSHQMHLLNEEESWNLLQDKVFVEESCPPELEDIGKSIAKKCGGLPLAILVVAGILIEAAMTEHHWKNVADNVSAAVSTADGNFSNILSLSYEHLPNYLKTCFLYIGAFSEGYEIPISNLIKLWVAEGFLKPNESKSLEEAAEDCLEDLVKRNLITKTKRTWTGRFKSCGMHDLLRDLCIQKAEDEKFIVVVDKNVNSRGTDIGESPRLAICNGMEVKVSNELLVRSILEFNFVWELSSLLSSSRLLRILAMPNSYLTSFPDEIMEMFHLRYLAFMYSSIGARSPLALPVTLWKLQNLQTLHIHRDAYQDATSPVILDVWNLPLLRHIILKRSVLLFPPPPRNCSVLENLQTVSKVIDFELTTMAISKIPNLKELKLVYTFPAYLGVRHLLHFHQLEKLNIDLYSTGMVKIYEAHDASKISVPFPVYYAFPTSLKRLCLRGCRPPSEDMSVIGQLPNLEVLKLKGFDFVDRCWETKDGEFKSLKFLYINLSNIINWRAESSHFPRLEHLIIQGCFVLEEVPFGIGDIGTLKFIEIDTCSQTAVDSALAIQEEQENLGNEELVVEIFSEIVDITFATTLSYSNCGLVPSVAAPIDGEKAKAMAKVIFTGHPLEFDERKNLVFLHEKLSFLQAFLDDHHLHEAGEMIPSLEAKIRETAYQAQDIIEQHISDQIQTSYENGGMKKGCCQTVLSTVRKKRQLRTLDKNYKAGLLEALDQINLIVEEVTNFKMMMQSVEASQISTAQTPALASSSQAGNSKMKMVGYEEDLIAIQERLCGESSKLNIIPIVGMGGIGKTTFARYIFDDSLIAYHFHTRAWATISQQYHLPGVLLGILHSFTLEADLSTHANMTNEQLMERIYKKLKGMRYLILLDDVWTTEAWDDLRMFLPDDNNGSRIVITTRLGNVAEYVSSSPIHHMHLLNEEESWNMLQEKVFVEESCPPELEEIGKMIAKNCGGLPLAILVVAGILTMVAMKELYWRNLAENVSVVVATVDGNFSKLLRLSYDHLPNHLKPCFLYVGGFAVYYEIPVSDLIKLWVAEGFLKPIESKTLEEAAEEYLEDLVKRNLVTMTKKAWTGRFKCCSMHDLLRELCIQIAQEENFLAVADMYGDIHGADFANSRRLSISSPMEIKVSNPSELLIRSVLQFSFAWRVSSLISCSRLLRVLAMPNAWLRSFPDETTEMFHLRYLAFAYINFSPVPFMLPPAILKLENLQTLIINRSSDIRSQLPVPLDIWKMPQLRHIILKGCLLLIPSPPRIGGSIHVLENLQTVSSVANFKFGREAIAMIPNVKKMKVVHSSREWSEFGLTNLVHFHQLETLSLHLLGTGIVKTSDYFTETIPDPIPMYYALPTSIRRLSLTGCRPPLEDMSIIGSLPNLEVLKLKIFDFVDRCWETKEGEFVRLKFLQINWSNLMSWRTESSHLPRLEHLIVKCCWNLEEIPSEFGDIATLKVIDLEACSQFVAQSALAIQQEQENMGNELLVKVLNEF